MRAGCDEFSADESTYSGRNTKAILVRVFLVVSLMFIQLIIFRFRSRGRSFVELKLKGFFDPENRKFFHLE